LLAPIKDALLALAFVPVREHTVSDKTYRLRLRPFPPSVLRTMLMDLLLDLRHWGSETRLPANYGEQSVARRLAELSLMGLPEPIRSRVRQSPVITELLKQEQPAYALFAPLPGGTLPVSISTLPNAAVLLAVYMDAAHQ
jgi:hypothetical protein